MANRDNPHGLMPIGRTIDGGEPLIKSFSKDASEATALFVWDVVNREADGNLADGGTPGTTTYTGVNLNYGAGSALTTHLVVVSPGALFVAQDNNDTNGFDAADMGLNVNFEFNAGSTDTLISGHELDESTVNTTSTLDAKMLEIWDKPDNAAGANVDVVVLINKHRLSQGAGTAGV